MTKCKLAIYFGTDTVKYDLMPSGLYFPVGKASLARKLSIKMRKKVSTRWPKEGAAHKLDGKAYELELSRVYCRFELEREAIIYFQKERNCTEPLSTRQS